MTKNLFSTCLLLALCPFLLNAQTAHASATIPVGSGFHSPYGVAVDGSGNVFVANSQSAQIAGTLSGTQPFPTAPVATTSAPLTIYFTFDTSGTLASTPYVVLTQGAPNSDFQAAPAQPSNACIGGQAYNAGDICAVNVTFTPSEPYQRMGAVQLMGASGTPIATYNLHGVGTAAQVIFPSNSAVSIISNSFNNPTGVAVDGRGNVYVADQRNNAVKQITAVNGGVSSSSNVITLGSGFSLPSSVAVDGSGNIFVADTQNNAIKEIAAVNGIVPANAIPITVGSGFTNPAGVAVDGSGNVFVADTGNNAVKEIVAVNGMVSAASTVNVISSVFLSPQGVAVDGGGNVFVADSGHGAIQEIVAVNGVVTANSAVNVIGGGFNGPQGVAVDGSGNVYVGDTYNNAVKEILAVNGAVSSTSTVVSLGSGFSGPYAVAVSGSGNLFVADFSNNAVKELDRADPPTLAFATTNINSGASSDSPQSILFQNSGNAPLIAISPGLAIGANFAQVSGSGTPADCPATFSLMPGQECNVSISFQPVNVGQLPSMATFSDNALNANPSATQSIQLSGIALPPAQIITFNNPGTQLVSIPLTISASTTSNLALSFSTAGNCSNAGAVVTFTVAGTCTITVWQSGNSSFAPASVTQTVTVEADVAPAATNNGTFSSTNVNSTSSATTVTFTFDESETLAATPYVVMTKGALNLDFKAAATQPANVCAGGQTYNAGDTCALNVTFTPTRPYLRVGAVQLMGSSGTPVATFNLRGTGTGAQVIFPGNSALISINGSVSDIHIQPAGVAVDGSGNVYVTDYDNGLVKEIVAVNGVVSSSSTVIQVGSGFSQPTGVAVDGSGNVFVADSNHDAIKEIVAVNGVVSSSSTVIQVGSNFYHPEGVAVDASGNVFVADTRNFVVKEIVAVNGVVSSASTVITLPFGSGFYFPEGVAVDGSGNVFVADFGNSAVKEIVAVNGVASSSSNVIAVGSGFAEPEGVAVDGSGNVFVADPYGPTAVVEIMAENGMMAPVGSGYGGPTGVAVDGSGNLFVMDGSVKELDRADPPSLAFLATNINSASSNSPQSILFQNGGNATLTAVSPGLAIAGTNFTQVSGSSAGVPADCSASFSLTPGNECNLSISFIPVTGGPFQSTATFTDNALNANPSTAQIIQLSGQFSQNITFNNPGVQVVGVPLTLSASASSNLPVSFGVTGQCNVNGSAVTFTAPGSCTVTASQNGNSSYAAAQPVTQTFTVAALPITAASTNNNVFPAYTLCVSSGSGWNRAANCDTVFPQTFNYNINGGAAVASVQVVTQGLQNLDFTLANTSCPGTGDGGSCSVAVTFNPQAAGLRMGAIELLDANSNILTTTYISGVGIGAGIAFNTVSPVTLALKGISAPSAVAVDAAGNLYIADSSSNQLLEFGRGATSASSTIALPGPADAITLDGAGNIYLAISNVIYKISAGSTTAVAVTAGNFATVDGAGNLYVASSTGLIEYPASGTAAVTECPGAAIGAVVNAPGVFVVATATGIFSNDGATALTGLAGITGIMQDAAGDLFISEGAAGLFELTAGTSTPVALATGGSYTSLALDASGNIWAVNGTTIQEFPRSQAPALSFAPTTPGTTSSDSPKSISAQNIGNLPLSVTSFSTDPNFSGASACSSVAAGSFCNLSFSFTPYTTGPLAAALVPTDNVVGGTPSTFSLSGTGLATPIITFTIPNQTFGAAPFAVSAKSNSAGAFTYSLFSGNATVTPSGLVMLNGAGSVTVLATQAPSGNYAGGTQKALFTAAQAKPVIMWATPAPIVAGTPLSATQLNATASVQGTFSYSPMAGTVLGTGKQTLAVNFTPNDTTDYTSATASVQLNVEAPAVTLGIANTTQTYQVWTNFVIAPVYTGSRVPTGTVTLYLNGTALTTLPLGGNGAAYYTANPFNVGANILTASYSGDKYFAAGISAPVTITVLPAKVNFQASCWGGNVWEVAYQCTVNVSASTTIQPAGVITYSLDGAAPTTVALAGGNAPFTVPTLPAVGSHKLVINYAAQGNFAAGTPITESFTTAQGPTALQAYPSSYSLPAGSALNITGAATTPMSGLPPGTVTIYDNKIAIGTAPIAANGAITYKVASVSKGTHSYYVAYTGSTNYTAASSTPVTVTAN